MPDRSHNDPAARNAPVQGHRRDNIVPERGDDPYRAGRHYPEPTVCPDCGAVYGGGRWSWASRPHGNVHDERCPACERIRDRLPVGFVTITGPFLAAHREEILNLVNNIADRERAEHPLNRLMAVAPEAGGFLATTTDIHLPRRIGEALHEAYGGTLDFRYAEDEQVLRVSWQR